MSYEGYINCECGENIPVGYGYYFFNKEYLCPNCGKTNYKNGEMLREKKIINTKKS